MFPYLDLTGFKARTVVPASDVDIVESIEPGFTARRIAVRSSVLNSRLRKRYGQAAQGSSLPLGQNPPPLLAAGTTPPLIALIGRPVLGCLMMTLQVLAAGDLTSATFQWSRDAGGSWTIGPTLSGSGTSPPTVGVSGLSTLAAPSSLIAEITAAGVRGTSQFQWSTNGGATWTMATALSSSGTSPPPVTVVGASKLASPALLRILLESTGALGSTTFRYSLDGGVTFVTGVPTSGSAQLGASGLTAQFPPALYTSDNVYVGQGIPTAASVVLAGTGLALGFAAGTYATNNVYTGQGIPVGATVALTGTGMAAQFSVGAYTTDNVYAAATPVPETVLGWIVSGVQVDVMEKRGVNPQDPQMQRRYEELATADAQVKEAADSKDALFDLPVSEDLDSAVTTGGPLSYSETSPYVWMDLQSQTGSREDLSGSGSSQ